MEIPKKVYRDNHCQVIKVFDFEGIKIPQIAYVAYFKKSDNEYSFLFLTGENKGKVYDATKNSNGEYEFDGWETNCFTENRLTSSLVFNVSDLEKKAKSENKTRMMRYSSQLKGKNPFDLTNITRNIPKKVGAREYCEASMLKNGKVEFINYVRFRRIDDNTCLFQFLTGSCKGKSYKVTANVSGEYCFEGYTVQKDFDKKLLQYIPMTVKDLEERAEKRNHHALFAKKLHVNAKAEKFKKEPLDSENVM